MPPHQEGQHLTPTLKLIRRIGAGAMGTVWEAEDIGLGRLVAVKLMAAGYVNDEPSKARFRKEALSAARVRSPYVAMIFGHGLAEDEQPFIVMELLDGETLRQRITRLGPLPFDEVARLFGQVARGIAAAHKLGVVHRDIKPDNLFVIDDEGEPFVKVLDFGIAKQLDATSGPTTTGMFMGTAHYMSPEQYNDAKRVDHRTDLWAMGIVVYEALTGKTPFTGSSLPAMALSVTRGEFQPPSTLRGEIPKSLDDWMARALSLDVDARFGSSMEMAETLTAALRGPSEQSPNTKRTLAPQAALENAETEPASPQKMRIPAANKPDPAKRGGLLAAAVKTSAKAPASGVVQGAEPAVDIVEDRKRGVLSLSIGATSPRVLVFDKRGQSLFVAFMSAEIVCFDLSTKRVQWSCRLTTRPVCLDAGENILAVGCADGRIRLFDPARGLLQNTLEIDSTSVLALALDAGGRTLAAVGEDNRITFFRVASGERIHVAEEHEDAARCLAFDAKNGLWASGGRDSTVRIWDASFRRIQILRAHGSTVRSLAFAPDGSYLAAGLGDGSMLVWTTRRWDLYKTLTGHRKRISSVAFVPGAGIAGALVTGSADGTKRIWGVATGKTQLVLGAGRAAVECVAIAPDGRHIASAWADGKARIYRWPLDLGLDESRSAAK